LEGIETTNKCSSETNHSLFTCVQNRKEKKNDPNCASAVFRLMRQVCPSFGFCGMRLFITNFFFVVLVILCSYGLCASEVLENENSSNLVAISAQSDVIDGIELNFNCI
jgi:hypothetical protein